MAEDFNGDVPICGDPNGSCLGARVAVSTSGGLLENYNGRELPLDKDHDGAPDFPSLDFAALQSLVRGSLSAALPTPVSVNHVHDGNLVLIGTNSSPIMLNKDIFVSGDLVIKGVYQGTGTIYVSGNIYIPADLMAKNSVFPFPEDASAATKKARDLIKSGRNQALGLATAGSVFIADIGKQQNSDAGNELVTIYNHPSTPPNRLGPALGVEGVYTWYPGGKPAFDQLYEQAVSCLTGQRTQTGSFNKVEAFLYAKNTVAGVSRRASFTIRGGIIADYLHIISGASRCDGTTGQIGGRLSNKSYIEYDYRIATGNLRILEHLGSQFPK